MPRTPPPPLGLTLTLLRSAQGWSQKEVAQASGLSRGLLSEYETGSTVLTRERLVELATVLGWPPAAVDLALFSLGTIRIAPSGPSTPVDPDEEQRRIIDRAAALAAQEAALAVRAQLTREIREEKTRVGRRTAEGLWKRLKPLSIAERRVLVTGGREFQDPFLCERLCTASMEMAAISPVQARHLADLAILIAERLSGSAGWVSCLQGYAWAYTANSYRVANDLPKADAAFDRAWKLWERGAGVEPGLLYEARMFDLEASLRRAQRRFSDALRLHDKALAAATPGQASHLLLNKAFTLEQGGDFECSIQVLELAASSIQGEQPRLLCVLRFNQAVNLLHLDRVAEAEPLIGEARELAVQLGNELDLLRVLWLEGRVLASRGRKEEARAALEQVRQDFAAREMAYDFALVSLELAVHWLEQERADTVKALAQQMVWIFKAQGVHREALAAVELFQNAAEKEMLTVELARRLVAYLTNARNDPKLRFGA